MFKSFSISVVTPTRNRADMLPALEACIRAQTLLPDEWIIADSSDERREYTTVMRTRAARQRMETRWFPIEHHNTGFARNRSVEAATGDIIVHMDDDDFYGAGHIKYLVEGLIQSGKQVIGYSSGRFRDASRVYTYHSSRDGYAMGATLAYWRKYWETHIFPAYAIGEDNAFVYDAADRGQLATLNGEAHFMGGIHDGNTSPKRVVLGCQQWRVVA